MSTGKVMLADLNENRGLTPNYPITLDTEFDPADGADVARVSDPRLLDIVIKLNGFFMPHLTLPEAHILDHLGMREFFNLLNQRSQLLDARLYFISRGDGDFKMGPVILASERYSISQPRERFPLRSLLARKLGQDDPERHPWELSSFWDARGRDGSKRREEKRNRIREAEPAKRLAIAMDLLGPEYESYIGQADEIWDAHADVTRVPLPPPDYAGHLTHLVNAYKGAPEDKRREELADELIKQINSGSWIMRRC